MSCSQAKRSPCPPTETTWLYISVQQVTQSICCVAQNIERNVNLTQSFLFYSSNRNTVTANRCRKTESPELYSTWNSTAAKWITGNTKDFVQTLKLSACVRTEIQRSHSYFPWSAFKISFHSPSDIKASCCTQNKNFQQFIFLGLHGIFNVKITSSVRQNDHFTSLIHWIKTKTAVNQIYWSSPAFLYLKNYLPAFRMEGEVC